MKYLAILGRQPELGLLELESLYGADALERFGNGVAIVSQPLVIDRLGGTQKVAKVLWEGPAGDLLNLPLDTVDLPMRDSKTPFGVSLYGTNKAHPAVLKVGLTLKKRLRERGSVRLVTPTKGSALDAAQILHNQILDHGFELIIALSNNRMTIARTTAIQDIAWYSRRDYNRPARSAKVGMLPPKLAQIMINTTDSNFIYDPFCGTGVVLQEALLMGRGAGGSDLATDMVAASKENLSWLEPERGITSDSWSISHADATKVVLPDAPLAIVSEGYLGPNLSKTPSLGEITALRADLRELYIAALTNWSQQLPSGASVTITAPVWQNGRETLELVDQIEKIGYSFKDFTTVNSRQLIYRRPDQQVGRQLLVLRKQ